MPQLERQIPTIDRQIPPTDQNPRPMRGPLPQQPQQNLGEQQAEEYRNDFNTGADTETPQSVARPYPEDIGPMRDRAHVPSGPDEHDKDLPPAVAQGD